jgi:hypothetical protein
MFSPIRDDSSWNSRENSLELIELFSIVIPNNLTQNFTGAEEIPLSTTYGDNVVPC